MNEERFTQTLREDLAVIAFSDAQKKELIYHLRKPKPKPLRLQIAIVWMICLLLLVTTAVAWILYPSLSAWFADRQDGVSISPTFLTKELPSAPISTAIVGDVQFQFWEAYTDHYCFGVNVQCTPKEPSDSLVIKPYGGLLSELPEDPIGENVRFVSVESVYGYSTSEIYTCYELQEDHLWIQSEGQSNAVEESLICRISVASYHNEWDIVYAEMPIPTQSLEILDQCELSDVVIFPKTNYELHALSFLQTQLRVYYHYEGNGEHQPISYATRDLSMIVVDETGERITTPLPYDCPIPQKLSVQIIDLHNGEIIETQTLEREEQVFVCR